MKRLRTDITAALALLGLALVALPAAAASVDELEKAVLAEPQSAERTFELAQAYRSSEQTARGIAFLAQFHKTHKPNPMSLVWQGSLKASASSKGDDMEQRLNLLQAGLGDMDKAVRLFPADPRVRLVRASTISYFPAFLGMQAKAIPDLEQIVHSPQGMSAGALANAREALARLYRQVGREQDAAALGAAAADAGR